MSEKKHILIIRLSAMGDVVMNVPVVSALREAYPDAQITVLTRPFFQTFFADVQGINFVNLDLKGRHKGLLGIFRLFKDIKKLKVDSVADCHDVLRTKILRMLLRLSGKKVAVIDKGRKQKKNLTRKFRKVSTPLKPMIERYVDVIKSLGFNNITLKTELTKVVKPLPQGIKPKGKQSWVAYAPFAQHKGKIYPLKRSNALVSLLSQNFSKVFIFGGGVYEKEFAEYMQSTYPNVISAIGTMNLGEELALISNMDCMISMDSSSMHMSSLMGVPVVSVWGATHPAAGFYGFNQDPDNAVQLDLPCRPCSVYGNKECRFNDYHCLSEISEQKILEKVLKIVKI